MKYYMTKKEKERIMKQIRRRIPGPASDLSDPKVYKEVCRKYAEAITPELKAVDEARRRSMEHMDIWVDGGNVIVRGYNN